MSVKEKILRYKERWGEIRKTTGFRNIVLYLVFVLIATLFWLLMTLNDNVQDSIEMQFKVVNVPEGVTFINDPPRSITVEVRDKGTQLMRKGWLNKPVLEVNFKEYSRNGVFRFTSADMYASLRKEFGTNATISNVSVDSLHLAYTDLPGKMVPVKLNARIETESGKQLVTPLPIHPSKVTIFSGGDGPSDIYEVETEQLTLRDVGSSESVRVKIRPVAGVKIVPSEVTVDIKVESLVSKTCLVEIEAINVPPGIEMLLFPKQVQVQYFVPMSLESKDFSKAINVVADYNDVRLKESSKLRISLNGYSKELRDARLTVDSVEYTLMK